MDITGIKKGESVVLCDRRMSLMVNGKVYTTIVKPAMMYASETWAMKKSKYVAEMRVLIWMSGVTKVDRISNESIRVIMKVGKIAKKVQESSLKVVWASSEKRRILCGKNNDGDGGVVEEKERKSEAEVVG